MSQIETFRALHAGPEVLVLPNAWDAGSARITVAAGAKAVATSSAAVAWAQGYPDGEALPFAELLSVVRSIARRISVPLTADIEAGYGNAPAQALEAALQVMDCGAVGINIEDGTGAPDLLAAKIDRIKAKLGGALWVNARTDVYLHGLAEGEAAYDETLRRARQYLDAGADSIFIPLAVEDALLARFVAAIPAPLNFLAWTGLPDAARLKELGVLRLSAGSGIAKTSFNHIYTLAQDFLSQGSSAPLTAAIAIPGGLNALMRGD